MNNAEIPENPLDQSRPRARFRLLNALARLSILLALGGSTVLWVFAATMWIRSYWLGDRATWGSVNREQRITRQVTLTSGRGGLGIFIDDTGNAGGVFDPAPRDFRYRLEPTAAYPAIPDIDRQVGWHRGGLGFSLFTRKWMEHVRLQTTDSILSLHYWHESRILIVPWWAIMALATPIPLTAVLRRRRRLKQAPATR